MNNELKYVIQKALSALVFIIMMRVIYSYIPTNFFIPKEIIVVTNTKKDSVHVIANIEGQILFEENCTACHAIHKRDGFLIRGVEDRVKDKKLLYEWMRNSSKVLQSVDPYFNNLVKEYGGVRMRDFPRLTDEQIDAILNYIKEVEAQEQF